MLAVRPRLDEELARRVNRPIELTAETVWSEVAGRLRGTLNETTFRTWFSDVQGVRISDSELVVSVPNEFTRDWISGHFHALIEAAVAEITGEERELRFEIREAGAQREAAPASAAEPVRR